MLAALLNFFVHPSLASNVDRLLRVRILIAVLLTLVVQESAVLMVIIAKFPFIYGGSLTVISALSSAVLLLILRNTGSYLFCSIAATLITLALIVTGICFSGGFFDSPATQLIVAPLLMAYFFGGIRWGSYTAALSFITGLALVIFNMRGALFLQTIDSIELMHSSRLLISLINFTFISGMALAYEYAAVGLRRERDYEHEKYIRMAKTDPLTGLANRRNFDAMLAARMQNYDAANPAHHFALGYIDLDGFKPINDDYGHAVGDEVLCIVSDRLRGSLRDSEFVGRYGGDEFMLILEAPTSNGNVETNHIEPRHAAANSLAIVAQRLLAAIAQPISTSKGMVTVSGSIGLAQFPIDSSDIDTLKQAADAAMYEAKRSRSGWYICGSAAALGG
jgi:diguanylate cyclase (GGDEF)-like protein